MLRAGEIVAWTEWDTPTTEDNLRLRTALAATGVPAQARLDDKTPPLRITVEAARAIMEGVGNGAA